MYSRCAIISMVGRIQEKILQEAHELLMRCCDQRVTRMGEDI